MTLRRTWRAAPARRIAVLVALALAPAVLPLRAAAEPTREDRAAATALFDEGRKLAAAKKYAEACPKFEAAMRLDPGMGTLFNLSDCYEQTGRTASAWSGFRDVAAQAKAANLPEREQAARERAAALEPKLAKLRILVSPELSAAALTITRDGSQVPSALVGSAIPLDPGTHTLRVAAEGKEPFETQVTLSAKGGTVDVQVPVLAKAADGVGAGAATTAPTATGAPTATAATAPTAISTGAPPDASPRPWQKPLGITATALGVAGAGAGVALGFVAKGMFDDSNKANCDAATDVCNAEGRQQRADAVNLGNVATGVLVAGAVVGAAGIVLWITAPSAPAAAAAPRSGAASLNAGGAGGAGGARRAEGAGRAGSAGGAGHASGHGRTGGASAGGGGLSDVQVGATPGGLVVRGRF